MSDESSVGGDSIAEKTQEGEVPDIGPLQSYLRRKREMGEEWNTYHQEIDYGGDYVWFAGEGEGSMMMEDENVRNREISIYNWAKFEIKQRGEEEEGKEETKYKEDRPRHTWGGWRVRIQPAHEEERQDEESSTESEYVPGGGSADGSNSSP